MERQLAKQQQRHAQKVFYHNSLIPFCFLDLAVAKSLQSTRTVTDADDDDDAADVLTTTGYTC